MVHGVQRVYSLCAGVLLQAACPIAGTTHPDLSRSGLSSSLQPWDSPGRRGQLEVGPVLDLVIYKVIYKVMPHRAVPSALRTYGTQVIRYRMVLYGRCHPVRNGPQAIHYVAVVYGNPTPDEVGPPINASLGRVNVPLQTPEWVILWITFANRCRTPTPTRLNGQHRPALTRGTS